MTTEQLKRHETTVRMDHNLARRLKVIAAVQEVSVNDLIISALNETVMFYEADPDFKKRHKEWLATQRV